MSEDAFKFTPTPMLPGSGDLSRDEAATLRLYAAEAARARSRMSDDEEEDSATIVNYATRYCRSYYENEYNKTSYSTVQNDQPGHSNPSQAISDGTEHPPAPARVSTNAEKTDGGQHGTDVEGSGAQGQGYQDKQGHGEASGATRPTELDGEASAGRRAVACIGGKDDRAAPPGQGEGAQAEDDGGSPGATNNTKRKDAGDDKSEDRPLSLPVEDLRG